MVGRTVLRDTSDIFAANSRRRPAPLRSSSSSNGLSAVFRDAALLRRRTCLQKIIWILKSRRVASSFRVASSSCTRRYDSCTRTRRTLATALFRADRRNVRLRELVGRAVYTRIVHVARSQKDSGQPTLDVARTNRARHAAAVVRRIRRRAFADDRQRRRSAIPRRVGRMHPPGDRHRPLDGRMRRAGTRRHGKVFRLRAHASGAVLAHISTGNHFISQQFSFGFTLT